MIISGVANHGFGHVNFTCATRPLPYLLRLPRVRYSIGV